VNNFQKSIQKYGTYIEELRWRIVLITKAFIVFFAIGFFGTTPAVKLMMQYINMPDVTIVATSPFQLIELAMSVGFFVGSLFTVPLVVYHLYSFLKPGLLPTERRWFLLSLPVGLLLFLTGFAYGCGIMYYGIKLIAVMNADLGVANYWDIGTFISQIVLTASLLGLLFIFPIVITFLIRLGAITARALAEKRRHAIVIIVIIVSLLPPTDGVSLILMSLPLVLIFELTVFFNRHADNHRSLIV